MITLALPTRAQVLMLLHDLQDPLTLLSLACRVWPLLPPRVLCFTRFQIQGLAVPRSPIQGLRRVCQSLRRCGHVLLPRCPGGVRCHGTGAVRCPFSPVERAPWPRLALGPIWATVQHPGPPKVVLEVVQCARGERTGIGRIYCGGLPAGTVQLDGAGEGIRLAFTCLPGRAHLQPPFHAVTALEAALPDALWSRLPAGAAAVRHGVVTPMVRREADLIVEMPDPVHGWALSVGEIAGLLQARCGYNPQTAQVFAQMVVARGRGGVGDA